MPVTHGLTGNRREQPSGGQQALVKPPSESVVLADESHQVATTSERCRHKRLRARATTSEEVVRC
jgi:nitrite reductase/ring-hydroxylating ferredoxin subunit